MQKLIITLVAALVFTTSTWGGEIEMIFYPKSDTNIFKIYVYTDSLESIKKYKAIIKLEDTAPTQKIEMEFLYSLYSSKKFIWAGYESTDGVYASNNKVLKKYIKNIKINLDK